MSFLSQPKFIRNPALWLAMCLSLGIIIGRSLSLAWLYVGLFAVGLFVTAFLSRRSRAFRPVIAIACVLTGAVIYMHEQQSVSADRVKALYEAGTMESGSPVEIEGLLHSRPEPSVDGMFIALDATTIRLRNADRSASGRVRIFVPGKDQQSSGPDPISNLRSEISNSGSEQKVTDARSEIPDLKYGSRIRVACNLEREEQFRNPGVLSRPELLDRMGVDATCTVKSPLLIEHIADESVFLPFAWIFDRRAELIDIFRENLSPRAAGVMIASLLGNKYFLDKATADLFRDGGTFHILVISGLHITFIGGLLLLFLRQMTRNRWTQFVITAITLWTYTLAVGADVPVVRAAVMFTIVLFGYAIYRQSSLLNSLGVCALVLLAWRPADLFDSSFQLTFVSVAAIVAIAYPLLEHVKTIGSWFPSSQHPFPPNVSRWLRRFSEMVYWSTDIWSVESRRQIWSANIFKHPYWEARVKGVIQRLVRYLFEALTVSLIVQLSMLPLSVVYFHRVSFASILLNLWVGFFIAIESFAAVAGATVLSISTLLASGLFAIADQANWMMLALPRVFSDNGWASFRLPTYSAIGRAWYVLYFIPLIAFAIALARWNPFQLQGLSRRTVYSASGLSVTFLVLSVIVIAHPFSAVRPDGRLHIDFLDVGQGDSALVTFPLGETLLVDGGGQITYGGKDEEAEPFQRDVRGVGESVVSEVVWAKGYSRIDHILATHADADHIQGLVDVAKNFSIGSAVFARTPVSDPDFSSLAGVLSARRIATEVVSRGDVLKFGDATVEVLYPTASNDPNAASDNDHSVVMRIVYGGRAFLLTGDIERSAEADLVRGGGTLAADVVKVPHHGSRTSSTDEFIGAVHPQYAIVSVGRRSPFGHPHPEVVRRWESAGVRVMLTGERGMISISTDGKDLVVE